MPCSAITMSPSINLPRTTNHCLLVERPFRVPLFSSWTSQCHGPKEKGREAWEVSSCDRVNFHARLRPYKAKSNLCVRRGWMTALRHIPASRASLRYPSTGVLLPSDLSFAFRFSKPDSSFSVSWPMVRRPSYGTARPARLLAVGSIGIASRHLTPGVSHG